MSEPRQTTTFAWLIERNVVDHTSEWWTGDPGNDWTRDANLAVKFPSKTGAAAVMREMRFGGYCFVSEHGFIDVAAATPAREEPTGLREALGLMAARWEQTIATIEHEGDERPALAKTTRIQASSRRACLDDLRAALSRGTAEPEAGLDVDRLTRAMDAADPPVDGTPDDELHAEHLAYAKEIAAEYARLAPAPADGEEPE